MEPLETPLLVVPGQSLGPMHLGASLHEILHVIEADKKHYDQLDLVYHPKHHVTASIPVSLPKNGFRMRFDGPDQRLRLIEVTDFRRMRMAYKGQEVFKGRDERGFGPSFKRIYQLFGASYPGEYIPPKSGQGRGKYVLSYAGLAFTFSLQHSAWAPEKDHVSLLGSSAASNAEVMAIFEGSSWQAARDYLFTYAPSGPRMSAIATRPKDVLPPEIEVANVQEDGRTEFLRRDPAPPFTIVINETTPQDLIAELGAPDTTHKHNTDLLTAEQPAHKRSSSMSNGRTNAGSQPSSYSSTGTDTFDTDFDSGDADEDPTEHMSRETFWCYFSHGMDILVGPPKDESSNTSNDQSALSPNQRLVVLKVIIHGNIPGSYAFNRHRRLRWKLNFPKVPYLGPLNSETKFCGAGSDDQEGLLNALLHVFKDVWPESEMSRGKVVNRTWGGSGGGGGMSDSSFFLPDAEKELVEGGGSEQWLGNTKLYTFPGLGFEVLEGGGVATLTVY